MTGLPYCSLHVTELCGEMQGKFIVGRARLIIKNGTELETRVYRKPTNTGLLLHFQSHVDKRYKTGLLKTMLHRAYALSSTTEAFNEECDKLRSIFSRLDYPIGLINFTVDMFIQNITTKPGKKS